MRWSVSRGYGYRQFTRLLKPIFLKEAEKLLTRQSRSHTDSALALVSGLHRTDLQKWQHHRQTNGAHPEHDHEIPLADQVLANWMLARLPATIPCKSSSSAASPATSSNTGPVSFSDLIQLTPKVASHGFSAQLILQDMVHRGLVTESKGMVTLQTDAITGSGAEAVDHAMHHLGAAQQALLATGLRNIELPSEQRFLEQSIEVDGLHPPSIQTFHDAAQRQWRDALAQLLPLARQLSDQDEAQSGQYRLRLGIYFYADEEPPMDTRIREHDGLTPVTPANSGVHAPDQTAIPAATPPPQTD